jgi:hypothetical protein
MPVLTPAGMMRVPFFSWRVPCCLAIFTHSNHSLQLLFYAFMPSELSAREYVVGTSGPNAQFYHTSIFQELPTFFFLSCFKHSCLFYLPVLGLQRRYIACFHIIRIQASWILLVAYTEASDYCFPSSSGIHRHKLLLPIVEV